MRLACYFYFISIINKMLKNRQWLIVRSLKANKQVCTNITKILQQKNCWKNSILYTTPSQISFPDFPMPTSSFRLLTNGNQFPAGLRSFNVQLYRQRPTYRLARPYVRSNIRHDANDSRRRFCIENQNSRAYLPGTQILHTVQFSVVQ